MSIAIRAIEANAEKIWDVAYKMWSNPETGFNEVKAAQWNAELMESLGFRVDREYVGIKSCIRAVWGNGKPVIGFLGELDALPGLSQKLQTEKEAAVEGGPGHGCGHNLLAGACIGGAVGLKAYLEENDLPGTVVYYGCPAEEIIAGKVFMAKFGAFDDLDAALSYHPGSENRVAMGTYSGLNSAVFHFFGKTAHAGADPQNGRSALDAVELMNVGANYLREHINMTERIHYVIKNGGTAPNVVPDKASVWYYNRAQTRDEIVSTYNRIVDIARGAALMTGTTFEIEFLAGCYPTMHNKVMSDIAYQKMVEIGVPEYTEEELAFADALNKQSANYDKLMATGKFTAPLADRVEPIVSVNVYGSTDLADVEAICPGIMVRTAAYNYAAPSHSWHITACAGSTIGKKGMLYGAKIMAETAIELVIHPELLEQAQEEHRKGTGGKPYVCPIPDGVPVPQPSNG